MSSRLVNLDAVVQRKSVPLTARDLANLDLLKSSVEACNAAGLDLPVEGLSEAQLLHALIDASLRRARDAIADAGYAALAQSFVDDPEEKAVRQALRGRRRVQSDVES